MARSGALRLRIVPRLGRRCAGRTAIARWIVRSDALPAPRASLRVRRDALLAPSESLGVRSGAVLIPSRRLLVLPDSLRALRRSPGASKAPRDARSGARRGRREALRVLSAARGVRRASIGIGKRARRRRSEAFGARRAVLLRGSGAIRSRRDARPGRRASIRTRREAIRGRRASLRTRRDAQRARPVTRSVRPGTVPPEGAAWLRPSGRKDEGEEGVVGVPPLRCPQTTRVRDRALASRFRYVACPSALD